jgi:hypothetical protein
MKRFSATVLLEDLDRILPSYEGDKELLTWRMFQSVDGEEDFCFFDPTPSPSSSRAPSLTSSLEISVEGATSDSLRRSFSSVMEEALGEPSPSSSSFVPSTPSPSFLPSSSLLEEVGRMRELQKANTRTSGPVGKLKVSILQGRNLYSEDSTLGGLFGYYCTCSMTISTSRSRRSGAGDGVGGGNVTQKEKTSRMYNTLNPHWNGEFVFHQQNKLAELVLVCYLFRQLPVATSDSERLRYNSLDFVQPIGRLVFQPDRDLVKGKEIEEWHTLQNTSFSSSRSMVTEGEEQPPSQIQQQILLRLHYNSY